MSDLRAVIFDIGGVLTNVGRDRAVAALVAEGLDPKPVFALMDEAFNSADSNNPYHRAERGEVGLAAVLEWAEQRVPGASRVFDPEDELYVAGAVEFVPEMLDVARRARRAGIRVGALSNAIREWSEASTDEAALAFYRNVSPVVFSCDIGVRKPDPEAFRRMVGLLDVPAHETLLVDDSEVNCAAASALGLHAVHVTDAHRDASIVADVLRLERRQPGA